MKCSNRVCGYVSVTILAFFYSFSQWQLKNGMLYHQALFLVICQGHLKNLSIILWGRRLASICTGVMYQKGIICQDININILDRCGAVVRARYRRSSGRGFESH